MVASWTCMGVRSGQQRRSPRRSATTIYLVRRATSTVCFRQARVNLNFPWPTVIL